MVVQATERRLPEGMAAEELGQAVGSGPYVLVSYLDEFIPVGSFNEYVVFVLTQLGADGYIWTIRDEYSGEVVHEETTSTGELLFQPEQIGRIEIRVQVWIGYMTERLIQADLKMTQYVLPREGALEAMLDRDGAARADIETSRELVNELRGYIDAAAALTGDFGIPPRFLAAIAYKEALDRPKDPTGWRLLYNLSEMVNYPSVRRRELFLAAQEINNPGLANLFSVQEDNSLGVCQMKPQTLAMLLGKTPWIEATKGQTKKADKQIHKNWEALGEDDRIDLFNLLRFPKSNIRSCALMLAKLKNRDFQGAPHRWPQIGADELLLPDNARARQIIATEWNLGGTSTNREFADPIPYGRTKVPRIFAMPVLQFFFGNLKVSADLRDTAGHILECLSLDNHQYFGGETRVHGALRIAGDVGDEITAVDLQVIQRQKVVAQVPLAPAARSQLVVPFDADAVVEIAAPELLFAWPSFQLTGIDTSRDGEVSLRVAVTTRGGLRAAAGHGPVEVLVRYKGLLRIDPSGDPDPRDESLGGDDWIRPSARAVLDALPGIRVGDISKMHGGPFKQHRGHRRGQDVVARFDGLDARDAAAAQVLIGYLNIPVHGPRIGVIRVGFSGRDDPFWAAVRAARLTDGRLASDVVTPGSPELADTVELWIGP